MANQPLGFPFGFYVADNSPIDAKYGILDAGIWRPYLTTAEALAEIPIGIRYVGLTVNINKVEYWWAEGVTNAHLVAKNTGGVGGISWKNPVRAATTANITLSGLQTIDGVSLIADDRVLVKDQTTSSDNGIYVVASGAWVRAVDADSGADLQNAVVSVNEGTVNADTTWRQNADGVSVGNTAIVWMVFGSAGITGSTGPLDNAIIRADGTDGATVQPAPAMLDDSGNLALGTSSVAGDRTISVASSAANASLTLQPQGTGTVNIKASSISSESSILTLRRLDTTPVMVLGQDVITLGNTTGSSPFMISTAPGGASTFKPLTIMTGNSATAVGSGALTLRTGSTVSTVASGSIFITTGATTNNASGFSNSGHIYLDTGAVTSPNALEGSIGLFTTNGSFGGGEKVLFIANSPTIPSTSVTGGGVMYVKPGDGKPYWWTGTTEFPMTAAGIGGSTGPGDNAILRADGSGGSTLQNSTATITDGGKLQLLLDDASTNTVIHGQRITRTSSGTPAIGIGTGIEFEVETSAGNNKITNSVESVVTSVTPGNEYSNLVFKGMIQGSLVDLFRIEGAGSGPLPATRLVAQSRSVDFLSTGITVNSDIRINASMKVGITEGPTIERKLHVQDHHVTNNTVLYPLRLTRACQSSNGAIGVGTGMEFDTETGGGTNRVGSTIESVASVVTNGSENFDLIFRTMAGGAAAAERVRINSLGVGVGLTPTARLTLAAGTASVNTAPLKLTSGTALTTPEDGALEYHSSHLFFTIGSTRFQLDQQGGLNGLTANRIPYATGPSSLADDTAFTWDASNNALTVGNARLHTAGNGSNLFLGFFTGNFTLTGNQNIGIGASVLNGLTSGTSNTVIGVNSGVGITSGVQNVVLGFSALGALSTGNGNVAIGASALALTTGWENIGIGRFTGDNITTGSNNVIIGSSIDAPTAEGNGQLSIQNIIFGTNNTATGTSVSTGSIGIGTPSPDRKFHVEQQSSTTNTVTYVQRLTSTSSGSSVSAGIGVGIEFETELDQPTGNAIGGAIESVSNSLSFGTEYFDMVFKIMRNGTLVERAKFGGTLDDLDIGNVIRGKTIFSLDSPQNAIVSYAQRIRYTSSSTPQLGIGVGIEFDVETSSGNNEVGATIEVVTTDITAGSEDFDLILKTMSAGATAAERLRITSDGRLYGKALHNNPGAVSGTTNQYVASGTYTPTLTNGSNVTASTANVCQWIRVGNVVTVSGMVGIQATAGSGTFTAVRMTLPIASDLITVGQCAGTHNQSAPTENAGVIYSEISSNTAEFAFGAVSTASLNRLFTFTYLIS